MVKFINKVNVDDINKIFIDEGIKESTKQVYLNKFKHLIYYAINNQTSFDRPPNNELNNDDNRKKIIKYINKCLDDKKYNDAKVLLLKWVVCLKALGIDTKTLDKDVTRVTKKADNELIYKEANDKEKENEQTMNDIITKRDNYKIELDNLKNEILNKKLEKQTIKKQTEIKEDEREYKDTYIYYILCCLYSMLPALRSEDYFNTYLFLDASKDSIVTSGDLTDKNYIDLKTKKFVIKHYKTAESHGDRIIDLSNDLVKILTDYKKVLKFTYLICSPTGHKLVSSSFNRLSNDAVGLSTGMMRKLYVSSEVIDKNLPPIERKKIADIMGHSPAKQQHIYSRFSKLIHTDDKNIESLNLQKEVFLKLIKNIDKKIEKLSKINIDDVN
jgi:integrase